MDYTKVEFHIDPFIPWNEILIEKLAENAFESFTEEDNRLQAYIPSDQFKKEKLSEVVDSLGEEVKIHYHLEEIPNQNWNAVWESDFEPVEINKDIIIHAPFHDIDTIKYRYPIEIQPQMSFGTGHHQTTYLLSEALLDQEIKDKTVLDVGTGTGVLGILASKMGAQQVFGTDIEEGAYKNALENISRNDVTNFEVRKGDVDVIPQDKYDFIIANINKNVLMNHLSDYSARAKPNSVLMLSGFFESDIEELEEAAKKCYFRLGKVLTLEGWAVMILIKD